MIVSATRRADIPAFFAPWFMNRIQAGFAAVPNPFNSRQVARIPLAPEHTSAIVFWTRDPRPMLPHLAELASRGFAFSFQFTLLEYPATLHPGMPPLEVRLDAFKRLAQAIGPERVLWRYDPILLSTQTDTAFHLRSFEHLARALSGSTSRVTVSLMEPYRKGRARLAAAGVDLLAPKAAALAAMFTDMAAMARSYGMVPASCADDAGLHLLGFTPGACVDGELIARLSGRITPPGKDPHQRPACRCAPSKDIGMYDACPAGCVYCYATRNFALAKRNMQTHDPASPSLLGWHEPPAEGGGQGALHCVRNGLFHS